MLVKNCHFNSATRMHSADYAVARCPSVRPSFRLSVCHTPVLSLNGYIHCVPKKHVTTFSMIS